MFISLLNKHLAPHGANIVTPPARNLWPSGVTNDGPKLQINATWQTKPRH
jgi:hypothetical protein